MSDGAKHQEHLFEVTVSVPVLVGFRSSRPLTKDQAGDIARGWAKGVVDPQKLIAEHPIGAVSPDSEWLHTMWGEAEPVEVTPVELHVKQAYAE